MWVWTDSRDSDTVMIGDKLKAANGRKERWVSWAAVHIDGIHDMFGGDVKDAIDRSRGEPVEVYILAIRVDGEDVTRIDDAKHHATQALQAIGPNQTGIEHDLLEVVRWFENYDGDPT